MKPSVLVYAVGCSLVAACSTPPAPAGPITQKPEKDSTYHITNHASADNGPVDGLTVAEMKPLTEEAMRKYPAAKARFLKGLAKGEKFYVTIKLAAPDRRIEQVFMRVHSYDGDRVRGHIANNLEFIGDVFHRGDPVEFPEVMILDWVIVRPDGSEEGNWIGNYVDRKKRH